MTRQGLVAAFAVLDGFGVVHCLGVVGWGVGGLVGCDEFLFRLFGRFDDLCGSGVLVSAWGCSGWQRREARASGLGGLRLVEFAELLLVLAFGFVASEERADGFTD